MRNSFTFFLCQQLFLGFESVCLLIHAWTLSNNSKSSETQSEKPKYLISRERLEQEEAMWEESTIRGEESRRENVVVVEKRVILERKMIVGA